MQFYCRTANRMKQIVRTELNCLFTHICVANAHACQYNFCRARQFVNHIFIGIAIIFVRILRIVQFECDWEKFVKMLQEMYRIRWQRTCKSKLGLNILNTVLQSNVTCQIFRNIFLRQSHKQNRHPLKRWINTATSINFFQQFVGSGNTQVFRHRRFFTLEFRRSAKFNKNV